MQQCSYNPGSVAKNFPLSVPCHVSLTHFRIQSSPIFFFLHYKRKRKIYSLLMIIFASIKNCALLTLWPISGLPEIMPFPYFLYRKLTSRRQSALSIIRVANHGHG